MQAEEAQRDRALRQMIASEIADVGLTACAKWLQVDASNLRKFARGERGLSDEQKAAIGQRFWQRTQKLFGL